MPTLFDRWQQLMRDLGCMSSGCDSVGTLVIERWNEPHRHYHTTGHLRTCLDQLDAWHSQARQPSLLALALWFHDVIYDPQANDNEAASAEFARDCNDTLLLPADQLARVSDLVIATDHRLGPVADDSDALLLVDIDLAILASLPATYDRYAAAVRQEYQFVPEQAYRNGRAKVLQMFLDRKSIYLSPCASALEQPARDNLRRELNSLLQS